jgi:Mrp family chromosome partitioning ATPase/capsular polysaccharide biosynthesis protein
MDMADNYNSFEPGVFDAIKRYWKIAVAITVVMVGLAFVGTMLQPRSDIWVAETTLLVQDPQGGGLFSQSFTDSGRYVTNQVAFIESALVAERAAEIMNEELGVDYTDADITEGLEVLFTGESDEIVLQYSGAGEDIAITGANAVSQAYQEVRLSEAQRDLQASLEQLDASLAENRDRIAAIEVALEELDAQLENTDTATAREERIGILLDRLEELNTARIGAGVERKADIDADISAISSELANIQLADELLASSVDREPLLQERGRLIDNVASLEERRDELEVDSALAGGGILLSSPATEAIPPAEPATVRNLMLGTGMGIMLGLGTAYFLGLRRKLFTTRSQPELIFGSPLLGEVPNFADEKVDSQLPVVEAPTTASAEAHRFIASALSLRTRGLSTGPGGGSNGTGPAKGVVVAVVSAHDGGGKTTTVANTALAASRDGSRVAIVDADLGTRALTELLDGLWSPGEVDAAEIDRRLEVTPRAADGMRVDLIRARSDSYFLAAGGAASMLMTLRARYDMVFVDLPPILSVAYTASVLGAADGAIVVVSHRSNVSDSEDVRDRLELVGTPVLGYVYNRSPLRPDMLGAASGFANRVKLHQAEIEEPASQT